MRKTSGSQFGFAVVETLIAVVISIIVALGVASLQAQQAVQNKILSSQNNGTTLAAAIRSQLAHKESCVASIIQPPTNWANLGEMAVQLNLVTGDQLVRAGTTPAGYDLQVKSLHIENLVNYGVTNSGNTLLLGDIHLQTNSAVLSPNQRVSLKDTIAARMSFELNGATLVSCYAVDSTSDTSEEERQVCDMTAADDGNPATWVNGKCTIMDLQPQSTCTRMGGWWLNGTCSFRHGSVGAGCTCVPYNGNTNCSGSLGGTWTCWGGADPGGACPSNYDRHDTMDVSGGPTGFICVGE